jgi:hypothetical protein
VPILDSPSVRSGRQFHLDAPAVFIERNRSDGTAPRSTNPSASAGTEAAADNRAGNARAPSSHVSVVEISEGHLWLPTFYPGKSTGEADPMVSVHTSHREMFNNI